MDSPEVREPGDGGFAEPGAGRRALELLRRNRDFRLLFAAALVSFMGDWFLFVALAGLLYSLTGSPALVAALVAVNTIPFAVFTFVGGPLADRLDRRWLMVGADLARGVLALGFFLVRSPGDVWLAFVLTGAISALGALFEPASQAAMPNLVDREDLAGANVLFGSAWGTMLAVGSALGGLVVATLGREAAYLGDGASFVLSALLVLRIRGRFSEERPRHHEHPGVVAAVTETFRYARQDARVLALLTVKGGFGLGAGVIALLPLLALEVFGAGDGGTGLLFGFRGIGVVLGPFLARRFMRTDDVGSLFGVLAVCFLGYGAFYAAAPWMPALVLAALMSLAAHLGGGAQWTLSTYGLQSIVPDRIRGRVFAFDYGLVHLTIAVSSLAAGWTAERWGVRVGMFALACWALAYAAIWTAATTPVRRWGREAAPPPGRRRVADRS